MNIEVAQAAARHAAAFFVAGGLVRAGAVCALYVPMRGELDTASLAEALRGRGVTLALPVIVARDAPLAFRVWDRETALVDGPFGTRMPPESAPICRPDVLVVPLVAFDRAGYRLGYGGGYYDRTLAALRADGGAPVTAIGYAYAAQEVEAVPREAHDMPLDAVVTEAGVVRASRRLLTQPPQHEGH